MSRERRRARKAASRQTRNIVILSLVVIIVVVAVALLSAPSPRFFMTVHVYSAPVEYGSYEQLTDSELVGNSTVTITGPRNFGPETTPTGILGVPTQIPGGTYIISATKTGYNPGTTTLIIGTDCTGKQVLPDGNIICHVLVRLSNSASS